MMVKNKKTIQELLEFSIINVNKPSGITSFKTSQKIKNILNAKKTGHFGTLDLNVTGVLPVSLNRACKLCNYFISKDKEYIGKMRLHKEVSLEKLKSEMEKLTGKIMQKPPVKSQVKRVERQRTVYKWSIEKIEKKGKVIVFKAVVQGGTYIRKLISDLGEKIGGAHMIELKRTRAGIFKIKDSHTLEDIEKAFKEYDEGKEKALRQILVPAGIIQQVIKKIEIKKEAVDELLNGKPLMKKDLADSLSSANSLSNLEENLNIAVFYKDRFIGIYRIIDLLDKSNENLIIAKPEFVKN